VDLVPDVRDPADTEGHVVLGGPVGRVVVAGLESHGVAIVEAQIQPTAEIHSMANFEQARIANSGK